jgi:excisionase family DNA binding protein
MEDRWPSVPEIAGYLGFNSGVVYKWIDVRSLPRHKVGRLWKFKKKAADEWVKLSEANDAKGDHSER